MAKESNAPTSSTQSISAGRDAIGVVQIAGDSNQISVTTFVTSATPPQVLEALAAIQATLAANPATKALADAATDQAKAQEPDKGAIATQLETALKVAKTLPDWLDIARKIGPSVLTVGTWLGAQGAALLALLR